MLTLSAVLPATHIYFVTTANLVLGHPVSKPTIQYDPAIGNNQPCVFDMRSTLFASEDSKIL